MGGVLGAYAYGLWNLRRWVVPLSMAYAFYVPANSDLFWYLRTGPDMPPLASMLASLASGSSVRWHGHALDHRPGELDGPAAARG